MSRSAIVLLLCLNAHAETPHRFFAAAAVNLGYWHYDQSRAADRVFDGGALELGVNLGGAVAPGIILAGQAVADIHFPTTGTAPRSGKSIYAPAGGGCDLGFLFTWLPRPERPPIALDVSFGFNAAGSPGTWGGFGPYVALALTAFVAHWDRHHLGLDFRIKYAALFSSDIDADKNLVALHAGVVWVFH